MIYVLSQKIVGKGISDFFVISSPISILGKLVKFILFQSDIDCADGKGAIDMERNMASDHFLVFTEDQKKFSEQLLWFSIKENVFLFNFADKDELVAKEKIFNDKNKKTREYIRSLRDDYDVHKANKNIFAMANCIKKAEDIISGKIKIH